MSEDIGAALARVATRLEGAGIPYMVVGSVAALLHGRVRSTIDVHLVIDPSPASLDRFLASLEEERFYFSDEAAHDALTQRSQFNIIDFAAGLKVDLIVRKDREFSRSEFQRKREMAAFGLGGDALDAGYIEQWARSLDVLESWRRLRGSE